MNRGGAVASYLVVIYGAPLSGKTEVAWQLARGLPGKTALISTDQLLDGAIVQGGADAYAELEMVHTQLRLLTANYMKNGYHVVIEGPFYHERDGVVHRFEQDIDQVVSLMRQMTQKALTVHLTADAAVLRRRAERDGRPPGTVAEIDGCTGAGMVRGP
jgi:hypothetical protein